MGDGGPIIPGIPPPTGGGDQGFPTGPPITSSTQDIAPPDVPSDFARQHFDQYFRDCYTILRSYGMPQWVCQLIAAAIMIPVVSALMLKDVGLAILKVVMPPFAAVALSVIDDLRKQLDPQFAQLAVTVLGELMGADLDPSHIPTGTNFQAHLQRADQLGEIFHSLLISEFATKSTIEPADGFAAAKRFSGLVINFGTATGLIGLIGGLFPEVHIDEVREIGEEVARMLGLGRLHRLSVQPLIKIFMQEPYTWYLNSKFRPTQLTLGEVVNPFAQTTLPADMVTQSLAYLGYSDDKIKAILQMHSKNLSYSEVWGLKTRGILDATQADALYRRAGLQEPDIPTFEEVELLKSQEPWEKDALNAAADAYKFGNINRDELATMAKSLLHHDDLAALFMMAQDYKRKVPHRSLTVAQLESAFADGFINLDEFDARLSTMGYSDDDVAVLRYLTLLKLQKADEAAKAKAAKTSKSTSTSTSTSTPTSPPPVVPNPPLTT